MEKIKTIELSKIRIDGGTQMRVTMSPEHIGSLKESIAEMGEKLPPMRVCFDGSEYWLVDGFHRYHAYNQLGHQTVDVVWTEGSQQDAIVASFGVNGDHGLPRDRATKRRIVEQAISHPVFLKASHKVVAKACAVSSTFVAAMRDPKVKEKQKKQVVKHFAKKIQEEDTPSPETAAPDDAEIKALDEAMISDTKLVHKILESEQGAKEAFDECKKLNLQLAHSEIKIRELQTENAELKKQVKRLQAVLDKHNKGK